MVGIKDVIIIVIYFDLIAVFPSLVPWIQPSNRDSI